MPPHPLACLPSGWRLAPSTPAGWHLQPAAAAAPESPTSEAPLLLQVVQRLPHREPGAGGWGRGGRGGILRGQLSRAQQCREQPCRKRLLSPLHCTAPSASFQPSTVKHATAVIHLACQQTLAPAADGQPAGGSSCRRHGSDGPDRRGGALRHSAWQQESRRWAAGGRATG